MPSECLVYPSIIPFFVLWHLDNFIYRINTGHAADSVHCGLTTCAPTAENLHSRCEPVFPTVNNLKGV